MVVRPIVFVKALIQWVEEPGIVNCSELQTNPNQKF